MKTLLPDDLYVFFHSRTKTGNTTEDDDNDSTLLMTTSLLVQRCDHDDVSGSNEMIDDGAVQSIPIHSDHLFFLQLCTVLHCMRFRFQKHIINRQLWS
jgi:hypothetical protein